MIDVESEEVYRINVKPSINPSIKSNNAASVIINMGFSIILKNLPRNVNKNFIFTCKGNKDMVINKGNLHISAKYIKGSKKGNVENIYPGQNKWFEHGDVVIENETCSMSEEK
ncbi:hypothetical protein M2263_004569 [Providencia alcalifaciens]|nr:hypothetical protein [Providencia alcalifaciens]